MVERASTRAAARAPVLAITTDLPPTRVVRLHGLLRVWCRIFIFEVACDKREARSHADHKQGVRNVQEVLWHVIPQQMPPAQTL